MRATINLLPSRSGNIGILLLNNPKPLHALNLEMIHCLQDVLRQWYQDESLAAILLKSSSTTKIPAFCAGGDVKQVYQAGLQQTDEASHGYGVPGVETAEFFRQEYYANHMLATSPPNIPQISIWDGVTMGGGVGISQHGRYRIATERTTWAMPETAIGLFPDVGMMYWMTHFLPSLSVARYLALTGARLKAPDLIDMGIATHYVPSERLQELEDELVMASHTLKTTSTTESVVAPILQSFHENPSECLQLDKAAIEQAFGEPHSTMEEIVTALESMQKSEFGKTTLETLKSVSPTSLKVTLEGLRRGRATSSITEDFQMEYRMSQTFMRHGSDFYEGIRALLVDKDQLPQWKPATLHEVTEEKVQSYFEELEYEWEFPPELTVGTTSKL